MHDAIRDGGLPATISYVFCTREPGEAEGSDAFLRQVASYDIPALTLSFRRFRRERGGDSHWRTAYNTELMRMLETQPVDLLVLAGFLLVLDESIIRAYPTLNVHPAAPGGPVGAWQEVIWELIRLGARDTGVMTQLATAELDRGPVVTYCRFPLRGPLFDPLWAAIQGASLEALRESEGEDNALFQVIRQEGVKRETPLLVATLRAIAEGRIGITGGTVTDADSVSLPTGRDLTTEIETIVNAKSPL